ncbi:hypothetical protein TI04_05640 [Achromatium sp. WMS2]|nr:hypothetical protein TI04_05640 [Achromatium sp. WMS2]
MNKITYYILPFAMVAIIVALGYGLVSMLEITPADLSITQTETSTVQDQARTMRSRAQQPLKSQSNDVYFSNVFNFYPSAGAGQYQSVGDPIDVNDPFYTMRLASSEPVSVGPPLDASEEAASYLNQSSGPPQSVGDPIDASDENAALDSNSSASPQVVGDPIDANDTSASVNVNYESLGPPQIIGDPIDANAPITTP